MNSFNPMPVTLKSRHLIASFGRMRCFAGYPTLEEPKTFDNISVVDKRAARAFPLLLASIFLSAQASYSAVGSVKEST